MSATRRPGYFDADPEPVTVDLITERTDRLADMGECEYLDDATRDLLRWAASTIQLLANGY